MALHALSGNDPDRQFDRRPHREISFLCGEVAVRFQISGDPLDMFFKKIEAKDVSERKAE